MGAGPNGRFVAIDTADLTAFLTSKGFIPSVQGQEQVFVRHHDRNQNLMVKVYSSIRLGSSSARDCGEDAMRVVAIFDNGTKNFCIGKYPRIYRTAPHGLPQIERQQMVFNRLLERMREAYGRCNEWLREQNKRLSNG